MHGNKDSLSMLAEFIMSGLRKSLNCVLFAAEEVFYLSIVSGCTETSTKSTGDAQKCFPAPFGPFVNLVCPDFMRPIELGREVLSQNLVSAFGHYASLIMK
jgi:hypothetical protein